MAKKSKKDNGIRGIVTGLVVLQVMVMMAALMVTATTNYDYSTIFGTNGDSSYPIWIGALVPILVVSSRGKKIETKNWKLLVFLGVGVLLLSVFALVFALNVRRIVQ